MKTEIEKALSEFNEVMAELKNSSILKDDNEETVDMMDEQVQEEGSVEMEAYDDKEKESYMNKEEEEEPDMDKEADMKDEMKAEFKEFVEAKAESIDTLDLSRQNIEKAYEQFKAEREEARAYEVIKAEFEARYNNDLVAEADAIAKSKFNAADAVLSLKEEFSQLKKSLENNTIAKAAETQSVSNQLSEDFDNISEMSWNQVHELMDKYNRGA
jgi:hypothetical protein